MALARLQHKGKHDNIDSAGTCLKETACRRTCSRSRGQHIIDEKNPPAGDLSLVSPRNRKGAAKVLLAFPAGIPPGSVSCAVERAQARHRVPA